MIKRFTLSALALMLVGGLCAQSTNMSYARNARITHENLQAKKALTNQTRNALLSEDFTTWPPEGWTIDGGATTSSEDAWHQWNECAAAGFSYGNPAGTIDEWLISPEITLGENPVFRFTASTSAYWLIGQDVSDFNVKITKDNGENWTILYTEDSVVDIKTYEWFEAELFLNDFANETVKIAFQLKGANNGACAVDNVSVFDRFSTDLVMMNSVVNYNYVDDEEYNLSGYYGQMPLCFLDESKTLMMFNSVVKNFGTEPVNSRTVVTVTSPSNEVVFTDSVDKQLAVDQQDTLSISCVEGSEFTLETVELGEYIFNFRTFAIDEAGIEIQDPVDDNSTNVILDVTNETVSRCLGKRCTSYTSPGQWVGSESGDEIAARYQFPLPSDVADYLFLKSVTVGIHEYSEVDQSFQVVIEELIDGDWTPVANTDEIYLKTQDLGKKLEVEFQGQAFLFNNEYNFISMRARVVCNWETESSLCLMEEEIPNASMWTTLWYTTEGSSQFDGPYAIPNYTGKVPIISVDFDFDAGESINDNNFDEFGVYPNPANTTVNVSNVENSSIQIFNMLGSVVASIDSNDNIATIDISNLPVGTYIVKVSNEKGVGTRKFNVVK